MQVIDPHVHLWSLASGNYPWLEHPVPSLMGDYSPMAHDFTLTDLRRLAMEEGIDLLGMVNVEANPADPLQETAWLAEQMDGAESCDERLLPSALSVYVDLSAADAGEKIQAHLAITPRIRGVRQTLNVHQDPLFDYVGYHFMRDVIWRQQLALLEKYGLLFELQLYPNQMTEAAEIARQHPDLLIVINHAGMYVDRGGPRGWREWRDGLRALARHANVVIKLSGFAMLDHAWSLNSLRPLVFEAIDAFGVGRCMFASNFPVDGLYASYGRVWEAYAQLLKDASAQERSQLFVDNARRYYHIKEG